MTQINDINNVLESGFGRVRMLIYSKIEQALNNLAKSLVDVSVGYWDNNGHNLTGNTRTSLSAAVYMQGTMKTAFIGQNLLGLKAPVRVKLTAGEVFSGTDYDGALRVFQAKVFTDGKYGALTSLGFLRSYPFPASDCGIVVTSGTEYSEFIAKKYGYDVLISSYTAAKLLAQAEWKKIKL